MVIIRRKNVICEQISEGELMLYDAVNECTHLLNSTASTFYSLCADTTVENAINSYIKQYSSLDVSSSKLRNDAESIFNTLKAKGIIWEENLE